MEDVRPRGRPKKTWKEVVENKEDTMNRSKWRQLTITEYLERYGEPSQPDGPG